MRRSQLYLGSHVISNSIIRLRVDDRMSVGNAFYSASERLLRKVTICLKSKLDTHETTFKAFRMSTAMNSLRTWWLMPSKADEQAG